MIDFAGNVAFVTGGASGIGFGIATAFAEAGMKLVIADVDGEAAEKAAASLTERGADALGVWLDVTLQDAWSSAARQATDRFGQVDVLVNNAGIGQGRLPGGEPLLVHDISEDLFRMIIDINLIGVFLGVRTIAPMMIERGGGGTIVNTASMAGLIAPVGTAVYNASKHACIGLSESLRGELAPFDIRVSVFCPGGVRSNLTATSAARRQTLNAAGDGKQARLNTVPSTREVMAPEDAGRCVLAGIQRDDLYIFSHPEYHELVAERFEAILASLAGASSPGPCDPKAMLQTVRNPCYGEALAKRVVC